MSRTLEEVIEDLKLREGELVAYRRTEQNYSARIKSSNERLDSLNKQFEQKEQDHSLVASRGNQLRELKTRLSAVRNQQISLKDSCVSSLGPDIIGSIYLPSEQYAPSSRALEVKLQSEIAQLEAEHRFTLDSFFKLKRQEIRQEEHYGARLDDLGANLLFEIGRTQMKVVELLKEKQDLEQRIQ
jgi:flagellar motor switch/type III secretory pathway protein FliN